MQDAEDGNVVAPESIARNLGDQHQHERPRVIHDGVDMDQRDQGKQQRQTDDGMGGARTTPQDVIAQSVAPQEMCYYYLVVVSSTAEVSSPYRCTSSSLTTRAHARASITPAPAGQASTQSSASVACKRERLLRAARASASARPADAVVTPAPARSRCVPCRLRACPRPTERF